MVSILSRLHVIAVSKELNRSKELDIYVYSENKIFSYSPQWELEISWPYFAKIREIAQEVDEELFDWVDFYIKDGQEITRKDDKIFIDGKKVNPFRRLSKENFSNIGIVTSKIYNEFLRSREKSEDDTKEFLKDVFEQGFFSKEISDIIEAGFEHIIEVEDLNNLDKQIIVRTKIEGYQFIINFIKNILHNKGKRRIEFCEIFMSRVFMLESQNFIKV